MYDLKRQTAGILFFKNNFFYLGDYDNLVRLVWCKWSEGKEFVWQFELKRDKQICIKNI